MANTTLPYTATVINSINTGVAKEKQYNLYNWLLWLNSTRVVFNTPGKLVHRYWDFGQGSQNETQ